MGREFCKQGRTKKTHDQTAVDILLWLMPGILCVLGIIGIVVIFDRIPPEIEKH